MHADIDQPETESRTAPEFPKLVIAAGIIWVVVGALGVLSLAVSVAMAFGNQVPDLARGLSPPMGAFLIPVLFLFFGMKSVSGIARNTVVYGVGSFVLGVFEMGVGLMLLAGGIAVRAEQATIAGDMGILVTLFGTAHIVAGILALAGRASYRDWRRARQV
jgi:hypothetical protein